MVTLYPGGGCPPWLRAGWRVTADAESGHQWFGGPAKPRRPQLVDALACLDGLPAKGFQPA